MDTFFPRYTRFDPRVPLWCITPRISGCIHRFFDTSPISPSGRFVALTRLPAENRIPKPGDSAGILLVDLENGETHEVAQTCAWDTQLGAQVQWGATDTELFFNEMDLKTWRPYGVRLNPHTGRRDAMQGPVYMVSRDGQKALSPCLVRIQLVQRGYGVIVPDNCVPKNHRIPADDGIYITDVASGETRLLISIRELIETAQPPLQAELFENGDFYCFHVKWNPQGDRIMLVLHWLPKSPAERRWREVITMRADATEVFRAIPDELWRRGGHHPDWCPDGSSLTMNLKMGEDGLKFVRVKHDGSDLQVLSPLRGSGHPSMHPDGRHILTDVYLHEALAFGDGTTPIRWIDLKNQEESTLVRISNDPVWPGPAKILRIDPHPAWDRNYRRFVINGSDGGTRRVYLADMCGDLSVGNADKLAL